MDLLVAATPVMGPSQSLKAGAQPSPSFTQKANKCGLDIEWTPMFYYNSYQLIYLKIR